jgi:hypothetical protein
MTTGAFRTPLLRIPAGSLMFPFNIVRLPATNDQAAIDQMVAQNRMFYDGIRNAGGLLYPVTAMAMSKNDWKAHFGPSYSLLSSAKTPTSPPNTALVITAMLPATLSIFCSGCPAAA